MIDQTASSLTVALFVAVFAIIGGIINERYKRHQSKIAVAAVMYAEISALSEITFSNKTVQQWSALADILEKVPMYQFLKYIRLNPLKDPCSRPTSIILDCYLLRMLKT